MSEDPDPLVLTTPLFRDDRFEGFFVATGADVGEEIRLRSGPPRGFGSVRVEATVGATTWRTSVFPSAEHGFVLPVKAAVREAEGLEEGDPVTVRLVPVGT